MFYKFLRPIEPNYPKSVRASDWVGFMDAMNRNPQFVKETAGAIPWARRHGITMSPVEALENWAQCTFEKVVTSTGRVYGSEMAERLLGAEIAVVDSREALVSTHVDIGGDKPLVVWSTAFGSLLELLNSASTHCGPGVSRTEDLATLAVVRFFFLQQIFFRMSTIHQKRSRKQSIGSQGQALSTYFVLAHEAGHVALEHGAAKDLSVEQELEADSFAWFIYRDIARSIAPWRRPPLTPVVAALLAADGIERSTFLRRPSSHPMFSQRLAAVAVHEPGLLTEALPLQSLVAAASDPTCRTPDGTWASLSRSSVWRTDILKPSAYETSRVLDAMLDSPVELLDETLEGLEKIHPGLLLSQMVPQARRQGLSAMIKACLGCGVDMEQEWFDTSSPLPLPEVIDAFVEAACWDGVRPTGSYDRIIPSALSALLLTSCILTA